MSNQYQESKVEPTSVFQKKNKNSVNLFVSQIGNKDSNFYLPILITVLITILLLLSFFTVALIFRNDIEFSPSEYVNKGLEYFISALLIVFTFLISDVYWIKRIQNVDNGRFKFQFLIYIKQISEIVWLTNERIDERIFENRENEAEIREIFVISNLRRLADIKGSINSFFDNWGYFTIRDQRLIESITYFQNYLTVDIDGLSKFEYLGSHVDEIKTKLSTIGLNTKRIKDYIEGRIDDIEEVG